MLKVAAYTGGIHVPSARFRVGQFIGPLVGEGVKITDFSASLGAYPPHSRILRPIWAGATLASRLPSIMQGYRYDLALLQREMLSTYVTLESLTKHPRVLDVDDAIWVHRRGQFAVNLAKLCDGVICGNHFLAENFSQWNSRLVVIPTAVDTDRFFPAQPVEKPVIGWSGTSGGLRYLYGIESALAVVLEKTPDATLRIVSDQMPSFEKIPASRVEFIRWSPVNEVKAIQGMAVGIMPLEDSLLERGKCSFKMLTYMACGIPVVVSPVGTNAEVLSYGPVGIGAQSNDDWVSALLSLLGNRDERVDMGKHGRQAILENYSVKALAPKLAGALLQFA